MQESQHAIVNDTINHTLTGELAIPVRFLNYAQAAVRVGVSERTVWGWVKKEGLRHAKLDPAKHNSRVLIDAVDLDQFMEAKKQVLTPAAA